MVSDRLILPNCAESLQVVEERMDSFLSSLSPELDRFIPVIEYPAAVVASAGNSSRGRLSFSDMGPISIAGC